MIKYKYFTYEDPIEETINRCLSISPTKVLRTTTYLNQHHRDFIGRIDIIQKDKLPDYIEVTPISKAIFDKSYNSIISLLNLLKSRS